MLTVYGMRESGNCYKVQLLLDQLGRPYHWVEVDLFAGETRSPEFLLRNPSGKVPVVQLEDGRCLSESNAILCYLAEETPLLGTDSWMRAKVLQWLFFEQYSHEPAVAVARFICRFLPADHARRAELPGLRVAGAKALTLMERELAGQPFLAGDAYTIADIALFAYTHCADDGGIELASFPCIGAWLERVRSQPGFSSMHFAEPPDAALTS